MIEKAYMILDQTTMQSLADRRREALKLYLRSCIDVQDWHGVSDAANDLRELEAEQRGLGRA